ncbi:hypothetical protein FNV43_RR19062 [Rhamnella rubrinervis]|uniref:Morc S5 domain-containing protein n=1 Tax=Rhamnella rubrinervis TaxID=2594499 RepID=A0A8K0E5U0_9ROSA|nr:hypothetical protein FNV43_RR19062 [Rhamnella rubrinervis]
MPMPISTGSPYSAPLLRYLLLSASYIKILEKHLERQREELRKEKEDNRTEKVRRMKIGKAVKDSYNNVEQYLLWRASLTEESAFSFLKADNKDDYITYSGFCEALRQSNLMGHRHGLNDEETKGIVDYEKSDQGWRNLMRASLDDWNRNLATIVQWSPYASEQQLLQQDDGLLGLDFDADPHSYKSILYLRLPSYFRVILCSKDVEHLDIVDDMMVESVLPYKPKISGSNNSDVTTNVTLGFVKDAKAHIDIQGFNVYHRNQLIKTMPVSITMLVLVFKDSLGHCSCSFLEIIGPRRIGLAWWPVMVKEANKNPLYLRLIFVVFLLGQALWVQLDISGEVRNDALYFVSVTTMKLFHVIDYYTPIAQGIN